MLELKNICFSAEEDGVKKDILKDINLTVYDYIVNISAVAYIGGEPVFRIIRKLYAVISFNTASYFICRHICNRCIMRVAY